MIKINGTKDEYIIDLNESADGIYYLSVDSTSPCNISFVSDMNAMDVMIVGSNVLNINVDMPNLKKEGTIILHNLRRERLVIKLKPNLEAIRERVYVFKLGKYSIDGTHSRDCPRSVPRVRRDPS